MVELGCCPHPSLIPFTVLAYPSLSCCEGYLWLAPRELSGELPSADRYHLAWEIRTPPLHSQPPHRHQRLISKVQEASLWLPEKQFCCATWAAEPSLIDQAQARPYPKLYPCSTFPPSLSLLFLKSICQKFICPWILHSDSASREPNLRQNKTKNLYFNLKLRFSTLHSRQRCLQEGQQPQEKRKWVISYYISLWHYSTHHQLAAIFWNEYMIFLHLLKWIYDFLFKTKNIL